MNIVRISDGEAISITDLISLFPNSSIPVLISDELLSELGYARVHSSEKPNFDDALFRCFLGTPILDNGVWVEQWIVEALPPEVQAANLKRKFEGALDAYLDSVAQTRRYDNRFTCALRAGYPGPFQAEGAAFANWMDSCNATAYQILFDVQAGLRAPPSSVESFISELPVMVWP